MPDLDDDSAIPHTAGAPRLIAQWQDARFDTPLACELGGTLPSYTIRYETYGTLNAARDNAILVCHALSGDHHCAGYHSPSDPKPGWWDNLIGPGKPVDTDHWFVIGTNSLGGCAGSTGPSSTNPSTGRPYGLDFPEVTIRDMVRAQQRLVCERLGIPRLHAVIGGSMGGMQALQWAIDFPSAVRRILLLATSASTSAEAIAFNAIGRNAIMSDPRWKGGAYEPGHGPDDGLAIARMVGHVTYLCKASMERKFGRRKRFDRPATPLGVEFEVESYLRHQGTKFTARFDANSYLYITKAIDRFDLGRGDALVRALAPVQAETLVLAYTSDWLYTPAENQAIADALRAAGKRADYHLIDLDLGHDSFLLESERTDSLVAGFLQRP